MLGCLEAYRVLAETSYVDGDQEKRLYYLRKGAEAGSEECRKDLISYYTMQAMPVMRSVSRLSGQAHRNKEDKELWNIYIAQLKRQKNYTRKLLKQEMPIPGRSLPECIFIKGRK